MPKRKRIWIAAAITIYLVACTTRSADAMQIGAAAAGDGYAYGIRGIISEPSRFTFGADAKAYWISATFPDGTFFQSGWVDASNTWGSDKCTTGFGTFVTALDGMNNNALPDLYNLGHCGLTGTHDFSLRQVGTGVMTTYWRWSLDGVLYGPTLALNYSQVKFFRNTGDALSEIVHTGPIGQSAGFPSATYFPAIRFRKQDGTYVDASGATFFASSDRTCRYALRVDGENDFTTGLDSVIDPASCHVVGERLW